MVASANDAGVQLLVGRSHSFDAPYRAASGEGAGAPPAHHNHFGVVIASGERADLRPVSDGLDIYGEMARRFVPLPPPDIPRREVVDEFVAAVRAGRAPLYSGAWGRATLEVCLAILQSARSGREVGIRHQVGLPRE